MFGKHTKTQQDRLGYLGEWNFKNVRDPKKHSLSPHHLPRFKEDSRYKSADQVWALHTAQIPGPGQESPRSSYGISVPPVSSVSFSNNFCRSARCISVNCWVLWWISLFWLRLFVSCRKSEISLSWDPSGGANWDKYDHNLALRQSSESNIWATSCLQGKSLWILLTSSYIF